MRPRWRRVCSITASVSLGCWLVVPASAARISAFSSVSMPGLPGVVEEVDAGHHVGLKHRPVALLNLASGLQTDQVPLQASDRCVHLQLAAGFHSLADAVAQA